MSGEPLRESPASLAALIVIGTGAMTSATLSPVMLGLYIDELHLTASQASLALAAENGAYALGLLLFYLVLHRAKRPMLAATGLVVMIVTSLLTARAGGFVPLLAIRAAFGLAMGFTASTVFAAYAGRADPQRVWAIATFVNLTYAAILLTLSGWIAQTFGLLGIVAVLAMVAVIGLVCTRLIPPAPPPAALASKVVESGWTINVPAICGALALLCLYAGHTTLWSFQERMGLAVGLDRSQVGVLLGISVLGAIAGAILSMTAGNRFGQRGPNALAFAGLIASALLLALPVMAAYVAGAVIVKTAWFFGLPFILGALARLDRSGRWSSMGAALLALGSAIGPAIGATLAVYGPHMIGVLAAGLYLISFLFTVPLLAATPSSDQR
ncbi:MFS transporter [Sphingomonas sp.]|uniref:MFS transporter n=1 Tax=Sphingomonas sp. TaxID=28214 RepID=UPI003D6D4722